MSILPKEVRDSFLEELGLESSSKESIEVGPDPVSDGELLNNFKEGGIIVRLTVQ